MKSSGKQWTDQLRSLSFTAIGTTQHDMDMDKGKLSKKIATTTLGGTKVRCTRGGCLLDQRPTPTPTPTNKDQGPWDHENQKTHPRTQRTTDQDEVFSLWAKFWCEIKIGIKSTMKPSQRQSEMDYIGPERDGNAGSGWVVGQMNSWTPSALVLNDLWHFPLPLLPYPACYVASPYANCFRESDKTMKFSLGCH